MGTRSKGRHRSDSDGNHRDFATSYKYAARGPAGEPKAARRIRRATNSKGMSSAINATFAEASLKRMAERRARRAKGLGRRPGNAKRRTRGRGV